MAYVIAVPSPQLTYAAPQGFVPVTVTVTAWPAAAEVGCAVTPWTVPAEARTGAASRTADVTRRAVQPVMQDQSQDSDPIKNQDLTPVSPGEGDRRVRPAGWRRAWRTWPPPSHAGRGGYCTTPCAPPPASRTPRTPGPAAWARPSSRTASGGNP